MKDRDVNIKFKKDPVLLDKMLQELQQKLMESLPWLNVAFGRAYKLARHDEGGNKFLYPAAYNGKSEYISLMPNDNYGNFSWFDIYDPQEITPISQSLPQYTFSGALIFWYNLDSIYDNNDFVYTEEVKNEVLRLLTTPGIVSGASRLNITKVYERFENIYKGYSLEKVYNNWAYKGEGVATYDKQFFMHPYAGLRIEFNITTRNLCQYYIK